MTLDQAVLITWTPYRRKGFHYESVIKYSFKGINHTITNKFDFIAYHLIKWHHGEQIFQKMISDRIEQAKNEIRNG